MAMKHLPLVCVLLMVCSVAQQVSSVENHEAEEYWKEELPNVPIPQGIITNNLLQWNGVKSLVTKGEAPQGSNMDKVDDVIGSNDLKKLSIDQKDHEKLSLRAWLVISHGGVFIEDSLRVGMKVKHQFHNMEKAPFMPKELAKSFPFSKNQFTDILDRLSIDVNSVQATSINKTLNLCSNLTLGDGEKRTCIRSLENMVDYATEELGTKDLKVFMMNGNTNFPNTRQEYVVTKVKKLFVKGNYAIGCHKLSYPYAVYLCHRQHDIGQYSVTLVNSATKAIFDSSIICHNDLFAPDVSALRDLGIQPGQGPICHLYVVDDIIWTSDPES